MDKSPYVEYKWSEYFVSQWLTGVFSKWQIYCTPPGYDGTNNPCEAGLNAQLKENYFKYEKQCILSCCETVSVVCMDQSKSNQITGQFMYKHYITLNPKFCSCSWFLDRGNCRHLVAVLILSGVESEEDRQFAAASVRGRPKLTKGALKK